MRAFKPKLEPLRILALDPAYHGDGLSAFTHRSARSKQPRKLVEAKPQTVRQLIERQEHALRDLYAEHRAGLADPVRLARVEQSIDIKQVFIAKLYAELGAAMRRGRA